MSTNDPKTFNELVAWACWEVIKGITRGESLNRTMHGVIDYARRWTPEPKPSQEGGNP